MDKCPYCNAETRPGDNFCLNCGNRLLPSTPSPQQAQPVIGDATIPASEGWASPGTEAPPPAAQESGWADDNQQTIANTRLEPPALSADISASSGAAAPVAQATLDKIEKPALLILRSDNGDVIQEYRLEKSETSVGRAPNSDILLSKDKLTSRRHATVTYENGQYILRDERSANGTFINGQQLEELTPHPLQDGDHIGIGEHELIFQSYKDASSGVDIESMPTIAVPSSAIADLTYRTQEDELLTASTNDDFSTRSMNGGDSSSSIGSEKLAVAPTPETPPAPGGAVPISVPTSDTPSLMDVPTPPVTPAEVTFSHLTSLPQPSLPDVAPLMAALSTLDGQVSALQEQLNATQENMRTHEADITQTANQLRLGVRRVSERMDTTIADVARNREQLAWAELMQLMDDVMNNPRDIEYVTRLARKARELNKVFQIHQNVLNTLAECTSLLRSLLGEEK
jgi:pSer/pThr/pTyr-binding forkhead associated (FHA) protein